MHRRDRHHVNHAAHSNSRDTLPAQVVGTRTDLTPQLRDHSGTGAGTSSKLPLAREASEFNPLQFLNDATGGTFFSEVGMSSMSDLKAEPLSSPAGPPSGAHMTLNPAALTRAPRQQPDAEMPSPSPQQPYRPGSAMSHRSAHSLSSTDVDGDTEDSSFYTTDMDTEGEPELDPLDVSPPPIARLDLLNIGGRRLGPSGTALANTINPRAALASSAPRTSTRHMTGTAAADASFVPSSRALGKKRSVRGVTSHDEDEESRRAERLEHRRSINRKSAQKHRLRRKEELEDLSVAVRERDDKIRSLERDLAVANARISQMASILQGLMIKDAEGGR